MKLPAYRSFAIPTSAYEVRMFDILERSAEALRQGEPVRSEALLRRGLYLRELLVRVLVGRILTSHQEHPEFGQELCRDQVGDLIRLARLGDELVYMLAEVSLALALERLLPDHGLPANLAPIALDRQQVELLLAAETQRLEASVKLGSYDVELWHQIGVLYRIRGNLPAAKEAFRRALYFKPNHLQAAARLAATLLEEKQTESVFLVLASAMPLTPTMARSPVGCGSESWPRVDRAGTALARDLGMGSELQRVDLMRAFETIEPLPVQKFAS